jgi:hypothetical protein
MQFHRRSGFARVSFVFLLASLACASLLWLSGQHRGQYAVEISSDGYSADSLGTRCGGIFDRLAIAPVNETIFLDENVPALAKVNLATFEVGYTGEPIEVSSVFSRALTVNGITHAISQEITTTTGIATDYLTVHPGETVSFEINLGARRGILDVTPLGRHLVGSVEPWASTVDREPLQAQLLLHDVSAR